MASDPHLLGLTAASLDRAADSRRSETMDDQQDRVPAALSSPDLANELLDRLRDRLAGMRDVDLPHGSPS